MPHAQAGQTCNDMTNMSSHEAMGPVEVTPSCAAHSQPCDIYVALVHQHIKHLERDFGILFEFKSRAQNLLRSNDGGRQRKHVIKFDSIAGEPLSKHIQDLLFAWAGSIIYCLGCGLSHDKRWLITNKLRPAFIDDSADSDG